MWYSNPDPNWAYAGGYIATPGGAYDPITGREWTNVNVTTGEYTDTGYARHLYPPKPAHPN